MTEPQALIFDFGGTLDVPGDHWLDRFLRHYAAAGITLTRSQLQPAFDYATSECYRRGPVKEVLELEPLLDLLVRLQFGYLARSAPDLGPWHDLRLARQIAFGFAKQTLAGMHQSRATLEALRKRFGLAVASNFYGNLTTVLAQGGLLELFDVVADSSRVGIFKPDSRLFVYVLSRLSVAFADAAMIGDSLEKDCQPARELGMRTVWLVARPSMPADGTYNQVDRTITHLDELVNLTW